MITITNTDWISNVITVITLIILTDKLIIIIW